MNTNRHFDKPLRSMVRFGGVALRRCLVLCFALAAGWVQAQLPVPTAICTANLLNRTAQLGPDGVIAIPNVPVQPGYYRVRVTCTDNGTTIFGQTAYFVLNPNGPTAIPPITYGAQSPIPISLNVTAPKTTLTTKGETIQLSAMVTLPNGSTVNWSTPALGTLWTSSNPNLASVDANGLLTAKARGTVILQANNEGILGSLTITILIPNDADNDGLPDEYEIANGLNPNNPSDAGQDLDGDNLTSSQEFQAGTSPRLFDTDGDSVSDGQEVLLGINPLKADTDADGIADGDEILLGTNPALADTDGDGIPDGLELRLALSPTVANPVTTVQGRVLDTNGAPAGGITLTLFDVLTAQTDVTGFFSLPNVPASLGPITAYAVLVRVGLVFNGSSAAVAGVPGGVTDVGTIQLTLDSGNVVGQVTDPLNSPVAGANVSVTVVSAAGTVTLVTATDANGNYRVRGLSAGSLLVTARDPNTGLRGFATGVLPQNASAIRDVRLGPAGTVAGTVFGRDTITPVGPGVSVNLSAGNQTTTTDPLGKYRFEFVSLGGYNAEATDANGNRGRSGGNISGTDQVRVSDISFLGRGVVRGVVRDGALNAVPNANVQLYSGSVFGGSATTVTDVQGRYALSNIFIGPFSISAQDPVTRFAGSGNGFIESNDQEVTNNITLAGSGSITGVVFRANGTTPVTNVNVVLSPSGRIATTGNGGQYAFTLVPFGTYSVSVTDPATGDKAQAGGISVTTQDEVKNQTLVLNGVGSVTVTVVNGANVAVNGANVTLTSQTVFGGSQAGVSQLGGLITFPNVLAGSFNVSATDPLTGLSGSTTGGVPDGGNANVTVQLQSAGSVLGTVFAADGTTPVPSFSVRIYGPVNRSQSTALNGGFRFDVLPTGTYSMEARDANNNLRARVNGIVVSSQGQEVTRNLILIGTGTVGGIVRKPDSTPAPANFPVSLQSQNPEFGGSFHTTTDVNGAYQIGNVPVGPFAATASGQIASTQYFGSVSGTVLSNTHNVTADISLVANVLPVNGNPANPSSITPILSLYDANNLIYNVTGLGSIQDGSVNVFLGDGNTNRGANILDVIVGGVPTRFFGQGSSAGQDGRELSIVQNGLAGLDVVRKAFVPRNSYFVRFFDVFSNATPNAITVDVRLTSHYRFISKVQGGFTFNREPRIISTSSGDSFLVVTNGGDPDRWVMVDDDEDGDPFLITTLPAVVDVFDGTNALDRAEVADFFVNFAANYGRLVKQWNSVTIAPGATVAFLHFTAEQVTRAGALASAERLAQLPPEALTGLSASELAAIRNFAPPPGGVSALPALPLLTGVVDGKVLGGDNVSPIPNAPVRFKSLNPLFGRTHNDTVGGDGRFNYAGLLNNFGTSKAVPVDGFTLSATHPLTGQLSPNTPGSFPVGLTLATQNVVFADSGVLTGIVRRHNNAVVSSGNVRITGPQLLNAINLAIAVNGSYKVNGLPADTYSLLATIPIADGSDLSGTASAVVVAGQTNVTDVFIQPTGGIGGTVRRQNNSVVVNLTVTLRGTNNLLRTAITDTGGRFSFADVPTGPVTLEAYDPVSNTAARNSSAVQTDLTATLDLTLSTGGTVIGVVRNPGGGVVNGAEVTLTSALGTQNTTTDVNGAYQFNLVPLGNVTIIASNSVNSLRGRAAGNLGVSGQTLNLDIQLQVSGSVAGTVRRPDGVTPVAGATVELSPLGISTISGVNGEYAFDFVPSGAFTVTATDPVNNETGSGSGNINFNGAALTVNVTLRPRILITGVTVTEGNVGTTNAVFEVRLSSASAASVGVSYATASGTAFTVTDFQNKIGSLVFTPGIRTQTVSVVVNGDVAIEPTESFSLELSSPVNANLGQFSAIGIIVNDDGLPGRIDHFTWDSIPSPQYANQPFQVKVTAKDAFGNTLSDFAGPVDLNAITTGGTVAKRILGDLVQSASGSGSYTFGYSFTPNTNIVVTHVRHYWGTKVSIWTEAGALVASQEVTSTPGTWVETVLAAPVVLNAGVRYRVGGYTGGGQYYLRYDGSPTFPDGTIDTSYQAFGDTFPNGSDGARWWLVDLKYTVGIPVSVPIVPAISGSFTAGSWMGDVTVSTLSSNMVLRAADNDGHAGLSSGFEVQFRDDVAVSVTDTPDPVGAGANLTYTVTITNTGPSGATGVLVTNFIPPNVTLGPVNAPSGSTSVNGRTVTWNIGALASGASLAMTIQVTPTVSGTITNLAGVSRAEVDGTTDNNLAVATTTVLLPSLTISDVMLTEGNVGTKNAAFEVQLSYPSLQTVTVNFASSNGNAFASVDYLATNGVLSFSPGETSKPVIVKLIGDVAPEPNEVFFVHLTNAVGATFADRTGQGTIQNDDGLPGLVDHFDWAVISSPQYVDTPFPVTITAKDALGATVTGFAGAASLSGGPADVVTNRILGDLTHSFSGTANYSFGYSFTPNTNITVTHVRSYSGVKVSIWTDGGSLIATEPVVSAEGAWVETPLTTPVVLQAGVRYRVSYYTGPQSYYYRQDGVGTFPHGTIHTSYQRSGDGFPNNSDGVRWWFVDLKYTVGDGTPVPITPVLTGNFTDGTWTGNVTVLSGHPRMALVADDNDGHRTASGPFAALHQNDLSLTLTDSPDPVGAGATLTYSLTVSNTGPLSAANVVVTNFLPASVVFVNATPSQGSAALAGRTVTASLGNLPGGASATVTINVTTTTSGQITNLAGVTRDGADASAANNTAQQVTTVLLPTISIADASVSEGDTGTADLVFTLQLSFPSSQTVTVNYATTNGSALAFADYNPTNGTVTFFPTQTNKNVIVKVRGDTQVEPNETFLLRLSTPVNSTIADNEATGLILNDDGLSGAIDHFEWAQIVSPQFVNEPFAVTITAKDYFGETVTTYASPVNLSGTPAGIDTNTIIGNVIPSFNFGGNYTMGYSFTPNTNLMVTHVRSYSGSKVSIWTDGGALIVSQPVAGTEGVWTETPLASPVTLTAGTRYRVSFYSAGGNVYYRTDGTTAFPYGTIDQGYEIFGDNFPTSGDGVFWWFVDLKYTVGDGTPIPVSPTVSGSFTNGVWSGDLTVLAPSTNLSLHATAATGHAGDANTIAVLLANDLGVSATANPVTADVRSNLTYSITVTNSGPGSATAVVLTNRLPGLVNLLSVTSSQGTLTTNGNELVFALGSLAGGATATATIIVKPVADGITLSNQCSIGRAEPDPFVGNNSVLITTSVRYLLGGGGRVAIYGAEGTAAWRTDVRNKIQASGLFTQVDEFRVMGGDPVPTLAQLLTYSAVLFYSDNSFNDPTALGNVLADYVDQGGGLVVATFALPNGLQGRLLSGNYLPFISGGGGGGSFQTLVKDQVDHPILNGVNSFNGGSSSYQNSVGVAAGATLVAHWTSNQPLIAVKPGVNGRVAGLNFFPPSSDGRSDFWLASTDGDLLLANALAWASGEGEQVPDDLALTVTDAPDPVGVGTNVTYTLTVSNSGPSAATGVVVSNVPPANASLVSFNSFQGTASNANGVVVFGLGNIPPETSVTMTVVVQTLAVGNVVNRAALTRGEPDGYLSNNQATNQTSVQFPFIRINDVAVGEGNAGTTNLVATVSLSVVSPVAVSVGYYTGNNSAASGSDFATNSGFVVFPPGTTNQTVTVVVNGDAFNEADETFFINLVNPTNASIADSVGVGTILNDDELPELAIDDVVVTEGDTGTTNAVFTVNLSAPSGRTVTVNYAAANSTALAASDYRATNGVLTFLAGETSKSVVVAVFGDVVIEADELFFVNLSGGNGNASVGDNQGVATIVNDDGLPGQLDHFDLSPISSPQVAGEPFPVTVTAKDAGGITVATFAGPVNFSAARGSQTTNVILGDINHSSSGSGTYTLGYAFTPNTNLTVTHVRSYFGTKVSIWTDTGTLVASQSVPFQPGIWTETPLAVPVVLQAGVRYRVAAYSGGSSYYWRSDGGSTFAYGTIDAGYERSGDIFPSNGSGGHWWQVDLKYTVGTAVPVSVSPTVSGSFVNGVWGGFVSILTPGTNLVLRATDGVGHSGAANPVDVIVTNDLELTMVGSPNPCEVGSNLTYTVTVTNNGPDTSTGVTVTSLLPPTLYFVSATPSQGSAGAAGQLVTCNLGTVPAGGVATVTIVTRPNADGLITNTATVGRTEAEGYLENNTASAVTRVNPPFFDTSFQITSLTTNGAVAREVEALVGDDRGGLVVSRDTVLLTGDGSSALFNATDLLGGISLNPKRYDALVGDLRTEKIYSLGNGVNLIGSGGGTVTTLLELDGSNGQPTGEVIPLSLPVTMTSSSSGIFSGYGRIVLFNGSRAYLVAVPSGVVTDLGAMSTPNHEFSESWANWGLTENFGGGTYLVYVRDDQSIVRTRVPDGVTTVLASFSDLSDMASINASVARGRWYFHHEGTSQFRSGDETLGYAEATFAVIGADGFANDLILTSRAAPSPVSVGGDLTYTLTVSNTGPALATDVLVSNTIPAGASLITFNSSQGTSSNANGVLVFALGNVPTGTNVTMTIVVQPGALGTLTNVATATRAEQDIYTPNNRTVIRTFVVEPTLQFVDSNASVMEGDGGTTNLVINLQLSAPSPQPVSVDFVTFDDDAVEGEDYLGTNGTAVFLPGQTVYSIIVPVIGDLLNEFNEYLGVELSNPTNVILLETQAYPVIVDNDPEPNLSIAGVSLAEGNIGTKDFEFLITLSAPSGKYISVNYQTLDDTAQEGLDYFPTNGYMEFFPGETSKIVTVAVNGETVVETDEAFVVELFNEDNANLVSDTAFGTIQNDDGFPGQIDHFVWSAISSPQEENAPFLATITALDATDALVNAFVGPVNLFAITPGTVNNVILGDVPHNSSFSDNATYGYAFTPDKDLTVTHVRHYYGTKVSVWTEGGSLVATKGVSSVPGTWLETPLDAAVVLTGGVTYRIGVYSAGQTYYRSALPGNFADGTILNGVVYYTSGDNFPQSSYSYPEFYLVDLRYEAAGFVSIPLSPTESGNFTGGMWTGELTVEVPADAVTLIADDGDGHFGQTAPFDVAPDGLLGGRTLSVPTILRLSVGSAGEIQLDVSGPKGGDCVIETSADLQHWSPLCTNNFASGHVLIVDPVETGGQGRFYRARLQP